MEKDLRVKRFETTAGMLFQFQTDRYNIVYATSDFNQIGEDLFYTPQNTDSELVVGMKIKLEGVKYNIVSTNGYANRSTICDFPDLLKGVKNKYSYVMVINLEKLK